MVITKADVYEEVIFAERPICPHCGCQMSVWECGDIDLFSGMGWDTPYMFACFNDRCPAFLEGWESIKRQSGYRCSYRCVQIPGTNNTQMMLVVSGAYGKAEVVDEAEITKDRSRGTADDPCVKELKHYFENKDIEALMTSLFDDTGYYKVRMRAAELLGELGFPDVLDSIIDHQFQDERISEKVHNAVERIHQLNKTRECPYCAEIVSAKLPACSKCGREMPVH